MIMLRDSVIQDIIQFLEHCEGNDPGQELQPLGYCHILAI